LNKATADFIQKHGNEDVRQLALRGTKNPEVDFPFALQQIAGRQTAREKLPSWAAIDGILYPPHLNMEQCSSEQTAQYKAAIARKSDELGTFVDLTGGFGVDFATIAKLFSSAVYVEQNPQLFAISSENFPLLGLSQAKAVCDDAVHYLQNLHQADLIFIDPARRDAHGARTYDIADCTPNVLELLPLLCQKATRILVKLSPMLDWRKAVSDIARHGGRVTEVHIVSIDNECKELLLLLGPKYPEISDNTDIPAPGNHFLPIFCANNGQVFSFHTSDGSHSISTNTVSLDDSSPDDVSSADIPYALTNPLPATEGCFLFEPNASVMKAGCFEELASLCSVRPLERNSHLFMAVSDVPLFPGRRFEILKITSMNKRELKSALSDISRANITVRNFPMTVAELRKRLKIHDGGDCYIFATTVEGEGHRLFICRKIG